MSERALKKFPSGVGTEDAREGELGVRRLFDVVDRRRWERLVDVFHPEIVYERPGYDALSGLERVRKFYEHERAIARGVHVLEWVVEMEGHVMCHGEFVGSLKSGDEVNVRFAEAYLFDEGLIRWRRTYFYQPAV